jgi:hypothetical protein
MHAVAGPKFWGCAKCGGNAGGDGIGESELAGPNDGRLACPNDRE